MWWRMMSAISAACSAAATSGSTRGRTAATVGRVWYVWTNRRLSRWIAAMRCANSTCCASPWSSSVGAFLLGLLAKRTAMALLLVAEAVTAEGDKSDDPMRFISELNCIWRNESARKLAIEILLAQCHQSPKNVSKSERTNNQE
jgi:hypothetical protein